MVTALQSLIEQSQTPYITAFLLGILMAISPCPLTTNITATAYLSKEITHKRRIFLNGISYLCGTITAYSTLGMLFYLGINKFVVADLLQHLGGVGFGIALIFAGILLLDVIPYRLPGMERLTTLGTRITQHKSYLSAYLMGLLFALAFCPYSGVIYFGILMPMTIASTSGLLLPPVFALAAGLPVLVVAWIIAYSLGSMSTFYDKVSVMQRLLKRAVALIFILAGGYYLLLNS